MKSALHGEEDAFPDRENLNYGIELMHFRFSGLINFSSLEAEVPCSAGYVLPFFANIHATSPVILIRISLVFFFFH